MDRLRIFLLVACGVYLLCYGVQLVSMNKDTEAYKHYSDAVNISMADIKDIEYSDFLNLATSGQIDHLYYELSEDYMYSTGGSSVYRTVNPHYDEFRKDMLDMGLTVEPLGKAVTPEDAELAASKVVSRVVFLFIVIAAIWFFVFMMSRRGNDHMTIIRGTAKSGVGTALGSSTSSDSKSLSNDKKNFNDIIGLEEVKYDLRTIVDFMKNPQKYSDAGAKLPRGIILYGPPGTGKTSLAKAISGEANVPFLTMNGSDFVEMFVGVGPKRVRELFAEAKKLAPSIIFVDEIDAIGCKRNTDQNGEDRKTLNAFLAELDGFSTSDNVLVIGATNRIEDLDAALIRPGRFTNKYCVPLPANAKERKLILEHYAKDKKLAEDVSLDDISKNTTGFSPADLENLLNEAAIISVQNDKAFITKDFVNEALLKISLQGHVRKNQKDREHDELLTVAWHEAGHAVLGLLSGDDVSQVTILSSTSGSGGVTFITPHKEHLLSVNEIKDRIVQLYGGRMAELILHKDDKMAVTTGASNDIEKATSLIKNMVQSYGFTDQFGLLDLGQLEVPKETLIAEEIKLATELGDRALKLLKENYEFLEELANSLYDNETLYKSDLDALYEKYASVVPFESEEGDEI